MTDWLASTVAHNKRVGRIWRYFLTCARCLMFSGAKYTYKHYYSKMDTSISESASERPGRRLSQANSHPRKKATMKRTATRKASTNGEGTLSRSIDDGNCKTQQYYSQVRMAVCTSLHTGGANWQFWSSADRHNVRHLRMANQVDFGYTAFRYAPQRLNHWWLHPCGWQEPFSQAIRAKPSQEIQTQKRR